MNFFKSPSPKDKDREIAWVNTIFLTSTPFLAIVLSVYYIAHYGLQWGDARTGRTDDHYRSARLHGH